MAWHRKIWADLALRAGGLPLLGLAGLILLRLFGMGPRAALPLDYCLAAIGFASASTGSALLWQGRHLFDQIALSPRWTLYAQSRTGRKAVSAD